MGEEVKKVEEDPKKVEAPAPTEAEKKEEAAATAESEEKEEPASNEPPPPPPPVILSINLHCTGCVNKIKRCVLRCKGVEGVETDMAQNQVTVKGIVDPQGICDRLRKRTMRNAIVISPPPPTPPAEGGAVAKEDPPPVVHSQVSEVQKVEVVVNMHCEACAQQLQKKILKMRGVQSADANFGAGKLTVTGTMSADKLVQYIHRRTGKLATVVPPPPPPEPPQEEEQPPKAEDGDKKPEEPAADGAEKKPEEPAADDASAANKESEGDNKEEEATKADDSGEKKEGDGSGDKKAQEEVVAVDGFPPEEMMKRMMYWPYSHKHFYNPQAEDEAMMPKRMPMVHPYAMPMMHQFYTAPPPPLAPPMMYQNYHYGVLERPAPAPQYFSDENPNACVIS